MNRKCELIATSDAIKRNPGGQAGCLAAGTRAYEGSET